VETVPVYLGLQFFVDFQHVSRLDSLPLVGQEQIKRFFEVLLLGSGQDHSAVIKLGSRSV